MGCKKLTYSQEENRTPFLGIWKRGAKEKPPLFFCDALEKNPATPNFCNDYTPFGGRFNSYTSGTDNKYLFQGQERQDETGWYHFKWRMHDPWLGRFISIDPLADKYVHNSTYAFSENKVTAHIELEGLEAVRAPRPGYRAGRAGGNLTNIRRTVSEAASITRRPSGFATLGRREGTMFTRTTTYSTSRGSGNTFSGSSGTNVGFQDEQHSFGTTSGNVAKVINDIRSYTQTLVDNADKIVVTESFTESGAFELSLGSDVMVGDMETTMQLTELQDQYNSSVMDIARGDLSAEEFGELDSGEQAMRMLFARIKAGPSPYDMVQQRIQESEKEDTTREDETFIGPGN